MTYVRKNHLDMSAEEKERFIEAVLEIKRLGIYDRFVKLHIRMNSRDYLNKDGGRRYGHINPGLMPWHRQYLLEFEKALHLVDPTVSLPYWDWTQDQGTDSPLWADDFLGGTGRPGDFQVTTGPFAHRNGWVINTSVLPDGPEDPWLEGNYTHDDRPYLVRDLGGMGRLSTPEELQETLALPVYDSPPWNHTSGYEAPYESFRNHAEGYAKFPWETELGKLHGCAHVWVGGHMLYIGSPNDPVFFLHHAFVDKIWAMWQEEHPNVPHYLPVERTRGVPSLHTWLPPWFTKTPADLIDHTRFYTYDT
ncbi:tyrosinase family protein [Nocardiopsis sp. EMB25]|uniref:tyrosinase family protein n=1 Tax=Nocardiopsis TaxID=2013 RepID=UPI00034D0882|nr:MULTISPECIES: tyrosinase family protein [Nocardiopsis]MCY9786948.1 tyrosinase family protein [Nocardiopsis sp. EMB25]